MLSATDLATLRAALTGSDPTVGPGLLPDVVDIQNRTEVSRSAAGVTWAYATADRGSAVACRFDPAEQVERLQNGVRVIVTEWPVCFAITTMPTHGQVLLRSGTRYLVTADDALSTWSGLAAVRVERLEAA